MTKENRCHLVTSENVQREHVQPPSSGRRILNVRCGSGDSVKYKKLANQSFCLLFLAKCNAKVLFSLLPIFAFIFFCQLNVF